MFKIPTVVGLLGRDLKHLLVYDEIMFLIQRVELAHQMLVLTLTKLVLFLQLLGLAFKVSHRLYADEIRSLLS